MNLHVNAETHRLKEVVLGTADNFDFAHADIINETQRKYYSDPANRPHRAKLIEQVEAFRACLEEIGVNVHRPTLLEGVPDQIMTRDIGVVIGDTLVVSHMAKASRQKEWQGLKPILDDTDSDHILFAPDEVIIEGGDVIVDGSRIFIGLSQRTNPAGVAFIRDNFPQYEIVPVPLKGVKEGEDVLHLDCAFVPVGENGALIYPQGFREMPAVIRDEYQWIEVTREEQQKLGTNVLSVSPNTVVSRASAKRINGRLRQLGLTVHELHYDEVTKTGGSFRCSTLPLWRG